jgi:hypothetical protein
MICGVSRYPYLQVIEFTVPAIERESAMVALMRKMGPQATVFVIG